MATGNSDDERPHDTDPLADTAHSGTGDESTAKPGRVSRSQRAVRSGDQLGRYTLEEEIGEGGMATVYRARDRELRREVAIKVLFPHLARRDEIVRRFHREARAAAGLEHPNILRIYDVGPGEPDTEDPPYIVMELVRGRSLLGELEARGPILAEIVACIGALLADALGAAHAKGIIHRDMKPANVMIAPGGKLLLADFGVARLETEDSSLVTKTGALLGTPAYMSPEQASGETATAKSDLYSLGATLYQLATGSLPYSGSPAKVLASIATGAMVSAVRRKAAVGPDLSRLIEWMMATDPDQRPADAAEVTRELRALAAVGGLGEPRDELAIYFEAPDEFLRTRTTTVVTAIVSAARTALEQSKLPRAMALADRASALAPDDPTVSELVQTVTEGGRASSRRRVLAFVGAGALVVGGAAVAGTQLFGGSSAAPGDAALAMVIDAAPLVVEPDAARFVDAAMLGDAALIDAALVDAPRGMRVIDARPMVVADAAVAMAIDAATPVDAAIAAPDAPLIENGKIVVENDTWCDVTIDGVAHGRITKRKIFDALAGRHTVVCEQPGIVGMRWSKDVDVIAGKPVTAKGTLLADVAVTIAITGGDFLMIDRIRYPRGTTAKLKPGRYRAVVLRGRDEGGAAGYLTIPRVPACTARELGNGLVCDP